MLRKLFLTLAVSALIISGISLVAAQSAAPAAPPAQSPASASAPAQAAQPRAQSATGKITSVSGDTFSIEVGNGDTKQTLQFVTDPSTAKSGQLKVGSTATVQYRAGDDGKMMATKVDVQG